MKKSKSHGVRSLMACASTLALCAMVPALAAAQSTEVGAPGQALTTGTVTTTTGGIADTGANGYVYINGTSAIATATNATINSTTANSYGLTASSANGGQAGGLVSLTLTGTNNIAGTYGSVGVHGVNENAYLSTAAGGGTYSGQLQADSQGDATVINGANTINGSTTQAGIQSYSAGSGNVILDSTGGAITAGTPLQATATGGNTTVGEGAGITTALNTTGTNTVGIAAFTSGAGAINVTTGVGGTINGGGEGIYASNANGSGSVTVNVGDVIGGTTAPTNTGIDARSGSGAVNITTSAAVTGGAYQGVYGAVAGGAGNIDLTVLGATQVKASEGTYLTNSGAGGITVTAADAGSSFVGTSGFAGIEARTAGGAIAVNVAGAATGSSNGVYVNSLGAANTTGGGDVSVGSANQRMGAATGMNTNGIFAAGAGNVTVYASTASGGTRGIGAFSQSYGTSDGAILVDASGPVTGGTYGIATNNNGLLATDTTTIRAGSVTSGTGSVISATTEMGDISITASGNLRVTPITGSNWDGVYAATTDTISNANIAITTSGSISSTDNGIEASTAGATNKGNITIAATGPITATYGGVLATAAGAGVINIGTANAPLGATTVANGYGVLAKGASDINIYTGAVTSTGGAAPIYVSGQASGANAAVGSYDSNNNYSVAPGSGYAVAAITTGGNVVISDAGQVKGGAAGGILAKTAAGTINISTAGVTTVGGRAVEADSSMGGAITINTGAVTSNGTAIDVSSGPLANNALGGGAVNLGSADQRLGTIVTTNPTATAIFVQGAGDVNVYTGAVSGRRGIQASSSSNGTSTGTSNGALVIDANGPILASNSYGILAFNDGALAANTLTIRAADVTSTNGSAISAASEAGDISITTTGTVLVNPTTGSYWDGIYAASILPSSDLNVAITASGPVSASNNGIEVNTVGGVANGGVTIAATGPISGIAGGILTRATGAGATNLGTANARLGTISASNGYGVLATANGDINIYTGAVTSAGGVAATIGANNVSNGASAASVTTTNNVATLNPGAGYGVAGISTGGNVLIDTGGLVTGGAAGGILAQTGGAGAVSITTADVTAAAGTAVEGDTTGGSITVATNGAISGAASGVSAVNQTTGSAGAITINTAAVTSGSGYAVAARNFGTGAVNLGSANQALGTVTSTNSTGVFAVSGGDINIYTGAVTGGTRGIVASSQYDGYGAVLVNSAGPIVASNGAGLTAQTFSETAAVTVNATGDITSTGGSAISTGSNGGAISINATGAITAYSGNDLNWDAIYAAGGDGGVSINASGAINGSFNGIEINNTGANQGGGITLTATGPITGQQGGVSATSTGTDAINLGSADTRLGVVSATSGVGVFASNVGDVNIYTGAVTASGGDAVTLVNNQASGVVTAVGPTSATGYGVAGLSSAGNVTINSNGLVTGGAAGGVLGQANGTGNVSITTAGVSAGANRAIEADANGGAISVTATGALTTTGTAIYASNTTGAVNVTTTADSSVAPGAAVGIDARTTSGAITINQNGSIGSAGDGNTVGLGISAQIASGSADLTINSTGGIYIAAGTGQQSAGIYAVNNGTGAINITSSGVIDPGAYGVVIQGAGPVSYAATGGGVSGDQGVLIASTGAGAVNVTSTGGATITGTTGVGLDAESAGGPVVVATTGAVNGATTGIVASTSGTGATSVTTTGTVTGGGVGISETAGTGGLTLAIKGNVTSTTGAAVNATSAGAANIAIASGATVSGLVNGSNPAVINIATASGQVSTVTVAQGATVTAAPGSTNNTAIQAMGGSVVVNNSGNINGTVDFSQLTGANTGALNNAPGTSFVTTGTSTFSAGNDNFANAGLLATGGAVTTFDFAGGTNVVTNTGTISVGSNPVLTTGSAFNLLHVNTFNNSGTITLQNGVAGDSVVAPGAAYVGSGAARLAVDTQVGTVGGRSDTLTVGSSSGRTTVLVHDTSAAGTFGALNPTGIVIVNGTTHAGDFVLDAGSPNYNPTIFGGAIDRAGFFFSQLAVNPTSQATVLVSAPKTQAYQFATLPTQIQTIWYATTPSPERQGALRDQLAHADEASSTKPGLWFKLNASTADRDVNPTYAAGGASYRYDSGYTQDIFSAMVGYDALGRGSNGVGIGYGVSGGYVDSKGDFNQYSTRADVNGFTLNGYATLVRDDYFVSGTIGGDVLRAKLKAPQLNGYTTQEADVTSIGGTIEAGVRKPFIYGSVIEPSVGLAYVHSTIDDLAAAGAKFSFDDPESLRVSIGARMSGTAGGLSTGDWRTRYEVSLRAVDDLDARNGVTLASGGPALNIDDNFQKQFGEVSIGLSSANHGGWTGAATLRERFNANYSDTGVSISARYRF